MEIKYAGFKKLNKEFVMKMITADDRETIVCRSTY
jgi:hypothetical protein